MSRTPLVTRLALLLCVVMLAYLAYKVRRLEQALKPSVEGAEPAPLVVPKADLSEAERSTVELFRNASASVVNITTMGVQTDPFRMRLLEIPKGTGSGFFWDNKGHIVTNLHVLQSANAAHVSLPDHSVWRAHLVGVSQRHDLAVLHVPGAVKLSKPLPIGTSRDLVVGQAVAAIGSPFGLDHTLSTGIVSGLGREIPGQSGLPIRDVIQTDAAINPGNSGGPLLDSSGRLIGVNTAIISPSGASAGIGFAVPVSTVARIVPQLIRYQREVRPVIGVDLANDAVVRRFGIRGALVLEVLPDSPAARAGVRATARNRDGSIRFGDVIVQLDDTRVTRVGDLHAALDEKQPGDQVTLHLQRDGKRVQVQLELAANVDLGGDAPD